MRENQSEVARLMEQITKEYEAATRGFRGLAQGTARHDFINARQENIGVCHEALQELVGENEAIKLVAQALNAVQDSPKERAKTGQTQQKEPTRP